MKHTLMKIIMQLKHPPNSGTQRLIFDKHPQYGPLPWKQNVTVKGQPSAFSFLWIS